MVSSPASGWYPDPGDPSMLRFWDGTEWTADVQPSQATLAVAQRIAEHSLWSPPSSSGPPAALKPTRPKRRWGRGIARVVATLVVLGLLGGGGWWGWQWYTKSSRDAVALLQRPVQRVQADGVSVELPGGGVALTSEQIAQLDDSIPEDGPGPDPAKGERYVAIVSGASFSELDRAKPGSDEAIPPVAAFLAIGAPEITGMDVLGGAGAQVFVEEFLEDEEGDYTRYKLESTSTSQSPFGPAATGSASGPRGPRGVLRVHAIVLPTGVFLLAIAAPTGETELADKVLFQAVSTLQLG